MAVLCIQELHMQDYSVLRKKSNYGKDYLFYYFGHQTKSINGVDIKENEQVNFELFTKTDCKIRKWKSK